MSTVVAIVKSIVGQVIATSAEGAQRVLVEGDRLFAGDTLDTGAGGAVTLELADGRTLDLGRDTQWTSADAANYSTTQSVAQAQSEVLDVQRAIAAGADPTQDLAPTAAGPGAGGAAGGGAGGSHSFVLLTETAGEVQPEIGIAFTDPAGGDAVVQEQAIGQEPNQAPVFTAADGNDSSATINVTTDEDTPLTGTLTARDGNGDALTYTLVGSGTSNGTLTLTPQGVWTYTPNANYNGPDSFQVTVSDGRGGSDTLTINIGVNPVNDAPVADPASASAVEDGAVVSGQLTASDVDSGDTQTFSVRSGTTAPAGFTLNTDGSWSFDPSNAAYQSLAEGEQQTLNIQFTVTDSGGLTSNSTLTITVTGVNDAAVLSSANVQVTEGDAPITTGGQLTISDIDSPATFAAQTGTQGTYGTFSVNAAGVWSYAADSAYNELNVGQSYIDTFDVYSADGTKTTVTVTINGTNDAPVANSATATGSEDPAAPIPVTLTGSDVDGTVTGYQVESLPTNGTLYLDAAGTTAAAVGDVVSGQLYFVPDANWNGNTTFDFHAIDNSGASSATSTASITVTPVPDAPTVTIVTDANDDGTLTNTELGTSTTVSVSVGLPSDAVAGNTLTVTSNGVPTVITLTPTDISNGSVAVDVPRPADGVTLNVSATITDDNGLTSTPGSDSAVVGDTTATAAPTVTIRTDINNDGTLSNTELGTSTSVAVHIDIPGDAVAGDTLSITTNTGDVRIITLTDTLIANGIDLNYPRPADGATLSVSATITDAAGNISQPGNDSAVVGDTTATAAPTVEISTDADNDGVLSKTELGASTTVNVKITLPGDAKVGDVLNITNPDGTVTPHTIVAADLSNGVTVTYPRPADGVAINVSATVTDAAGNVSQPGSDSATVGNTGATPAPVVTITTDANNDGTLSNTELNGSKTVWSRVDLPQGAEVGDTLKVYINGTQVLTLTVTQQMLSTGATIGASGFAGDGEAFTISATITDTVGNVSLPGSDTAVLGDTTATAAPTVTITTDTDNDGTLSNTELGASTTVAVKVTIPTGAVVGDTLTVTSNAGATQTITLTADQIANGVDLTYPRPADGVAVNVSATITDAAGNVSQPGTDSATVGDTTATAAPTVVITTDANNDGTLSNTELGASTTIAVKITVPTGAVVGDTLTVTSNAGATQTITLTADQIANGVDLTYPRPADGVAVNVSATITDAAGNVSQPGTDSATVGDTTATAAPTVVITTDANNDGILSSTELGASTTVAVKITVPTGAVVGDTLTVTSSAGATQTITLTADQIANGVDLTYPRPADGTAVNVSATITDAAGNVSQPGSDSATVGDTTATAAPTVTISTDTNNDGTLSNTELGASTTVTVKVTIPAGVVVGDTLTVTSNAGATQTVTLTADQIANGVDLTYPRPTDGSAINVSATITDAAGNISAPGTDSATVGDTTATAAPTVVITTDANNDGTLSSTELGASTTVAVKITVPNGAVVGDTLTVTSSAGATQTITLTADQIADGVDLTYPRPADGTAVNVSATITDAAGNVSQPGTDSATVGDTTATAAPTVTISTDTNNDGTLSNTELGSATTVAVKITVPTGAVVGDTLTVTSNADAPQTITLTADQIANGVDLTYPRPADGTSINVSATVTDAAGNTSAPGTDSATVGDTTATAAPTVTISTDTNNDGTLSNTELGNATTVAVKVSIPTGAVVGDTLTVTSNAGATQTITLTADQIANGVDLTYPRPADGGAINVSATVTDAAGNTSAPGTDSATVGDTTATAAPTVVITTDANNDGTLSNTELGNASTVAVKVTVPTDAVVGDTLTVTSSAGATQTITLTADQIANGVDLTYPRPADGTAVNVSATLTDAAGNVSQPGTDSATVGDTTATAAPTVVITTDANNDGTLSNTELGNATTVAVKVTIPTGAVVGDTLTVTSSAGATQTITLTADQIANGVDLTYPRPADGTAVNVSATITDAAGNTSAPGTDSATVGDTTATAAPTVTISTDTNNDGTLSNTELGTSTTVAVKIIVPTGAVVGDTLTVTSNAGATQTITLTADQIANGVDLTYPRPADGTSINVSATVTDAAGNTSAPGTDSATVGDTTATAAPTVVITTDTNNDGTLSNTELGASTTVAVKVTIPTGAVVGDTLTVTSSAGATQTITLTADQIANGVDLTYPRPADGTAVNVSATITDAAGNTSAPGTDSATVGDTTATAAPTVVISTDANNDGTLSTTELGNATTVAVKVTVPTGAVVGDTLTVTSNAGATQTITLTATQIANGVDLTYPRPADGTSINVSATVTDAAGNTSAPGTDSATVGDTTATAAPTVVITTDTNNDGTLSNTELGASTTVAVKVTIPTGAVVGDTLTVTSSAGATQNIALTADQIANGVDLTYPRPADGTAVNVSATITDAAGNTSAPGTDSATVGDTTATAAPTVTISTDTNNDGTLSNTELGASTNVAVKITVPTGAVVGDTLTVTSNAGATQTITLTANQIANGVDLTYPRPADGAAINVSATVTDAAGNTSAPGTDSATVGDTTATAAPTVVITTDTNNDGTLSNTELGNATTVAVKVTIPTGAVVGDTLTVTSNAGATQTITLTANQIANGVDLTYPRPADGSAVNVSATITDAAGNVSQPGTDSATVGDTTATAAPTVTISTDTNNDGTLSNTELGASTTVAVKVTIPTGAVVGDTLTVTSNAGATQTITLTANQIANGVDLTYPRPADGTAVNVSATITDAAGNVSQPGTDSATVGDTTATAAPTVTISTDTNNDGTLSNTELGNATTVAVKVTVPTGAVVGDTLTVTSNAGATQTITLTANQIANGVDLTYPRPGDGAAINVSATVTDAAGNTSAPGTDSATVGDTTATAAPTVTISTDTNNDGTLSNTELGNATTVAVKVTVPTGAVVGDTLTVTNNAGATQTITLTANQIANGVDLTYPRPADGAAINVSATITDAAGNVSQPGTDSATVGDTTAASAPVVTIVDDANNNAQLTAAEIGSDGVQVTVAVNNADLLAGGTVSLSINNGGVTHVANLALDNGVLVNAGTTTPATGYTYSNGTISFTEAKPATGASISVTATQSDTAGNVSPQGSDSAVVVNTNPDAIDDPVGTAYTVSLGDKGGALTTNNWGALDSKGLGVTVSAVKGDGTAGTVYSGNDDGNANTLGVAGTPRATGAVANQLEFDPSTKTSEGLVLNLNGNINHAEFSVSHLVSGESGGEVGRWVAMYNGSVVATGEFVLTSGAAGTFSIDTGSLVFDSIRFEAVSTVSGGGDGSDYFLTGFSGSGPASANGAYTVSEKGTLTIADGNKDLTANDVDADNDTLLVTKVNNQAIGNGAITLTSGALVTVNADGSFSYDTNGKFNALKAGEVATDTFTYTVSDGHGGTDTATATVTIIGTNDAPVITSSAAAAAGSVTEAGVTAAGAATAGSATATGTLTATDVDSPTTTWSVANGTGTYGSLTLSSAGVWTYNLDNAKAATQALKAGQTATETFTATVSDGAGGTATQVITVTVNGTNDAPVVTSASSAAAGSVTEAGVGTTGTNTATGTLTATDVDSTSPNWSVPNSGAGTYGSLSLTAGGVWTYTLDNSKPATQALAAGQSVTETFTATVSDGAGGTATQVITVTVNGTNDAPVVTSSAAAAAGSVTEAGLTPAGAATAGTATATGTLTATDADSPSTTWSVANGTGTYGSLTLSSAGVWTYNLDNAKAATQALKAGQTATETFTATVSDGAGGTATQVITVTVNGTNDAPVVTSAASAAAGSVTEAGVNASGGAVAGTATATGTLTATDVDSPTTSWSVANGAGTYGSLSITAGGAWTYTLDNAKAETQALAAGQTRTETFTATVSDGAGGTATQVITVTVNGTNDAPVVSNTSVTTGSVTEAGVNASGGAVAGTASATGTLVATDVDSPSTTWSVANGTGTYGSLTLNSAGVWTYNLDNAKPATQALKAGQTATETFTATVSDGAGGTATQVITVTVNGTNDAPVVTSSAAAAAGSVTEAGLTPAGAATAGTATATGTLTATDVDSTSTTWSVANGTGTYGSLTLSSAGVWTYTLDNAKPATQALAAGQTATETFTATVSDGAGGTATQVITVTVNGTNDAPVVTSAASAAAGSVTEAGVGTAGTASATGTLTATDVDSASTSWSVANGTGTYGSLTLSSAGVWTYNLDNSKAATQALKAGQSATETFTATVSDGAGGTATQQITVTVNGTNDAPTITSSAAAATGSVTEAGINASGGAVAGSPSATGTLTATDVDSASTTWSVANGTGTYGSLSITSAGVWTYNLDNSKAATQGLAVGQTATETFTATVSDGQGGTTTQQITVTVNGTNDAPVVTSSAAAAIGSVTEAGVTAAGVATNGTATATGTLTASDVDTSSTTWSVANGTGTYGSLTLSSAGVWTYTLDNSKPATQALGAGDTRTESFTATVSDGLGGTATQVITVTVNGTNDAPVAVNDSYTLGLTGQYFGYAQGSGANLESIAQVEALIAGKTPNATFTATSLNYSGVSSDLGAGSNLQTFLGSDASTLSTDPATTSDAIIKLSGQVSLAAGTYTFKVTSDDGFILRIDGQDVVKFDGNRSAAATTANFTIPTSGAHQIEIIYWDQGGNAVLKVETKVAGAADSTYTVLGASGNTSSLVTAEDTALTINASTLLKNDSDVDGGTLTLTSVQNASHGTVSLNNGVITFTPEANYNGEATFQYTVSDGKGGTASATVTLYVTPVNDAPTVSATPVALTGNEDTAIIITSAQLLANASDVDGNALTVTNLTKTSGQGTLVANSDGTWTFTPTKDWNGSVNFTYTVSDGTVGVADSAVLTVKPVADAFADTASTNEDTAITLNVLGNDTFSNTATITSINGTAISNNGSVTVDHGVVKLVNGQLVYTPTANYHGQSNFTYTVSSGGVTETAGVKLMINSVSDATTPTISVTPKGFWTFDATSGNSNNTTVSNATTGQTGTLKDIDSTGNSNNPTLSTGTGSGTRADGAGKYLSLNTGSDIGDIVQVSSSVTDALMGTATLTFWINTTQAGNSTGSSWNNPSIIGSEDVGGGNDIQWGAITSAGTIGLGLGNSNGVYSTTAINDGAWHNIAISRDASTGLVNVYVDGKLEASGSPTDAAFTGALNKLLEIGATNAFNSSGDVTDSNYYKGALDDLRIYSGVLTADQIAAINHVENGYQGTAIANAHTAAQNTLSLSVTDTASSLTVSGLESGMIISDGNGHTATSTGVDTVIDISNWTISSLTLGNTGTSSATLIFTGTNTHAGTGDTSTTYEALTLANGTSILTTGTTGNDTLNGSAAADLLRGGDGNDTLYGGAGNDRLEGGNGNDSLYGGAGNDLLIGGAGNDLLFGGSGNNIMTGGSGADTFTWQAGDVGKSTITDFNASEGDRISLGDLLPDINDTNVLSYLKVDTTTSTIQISTSGHVDQGADVTITLQGVDLTTYGASSSEIVKSLVAGSDPVVKTEHQ